MEPFVHPDSIVRKVWGKSDTVLFIFAGSAAEFALNRAVDWLYFTGRLPADPIGRLFSTVSYARKIIFAENQQAIETIDKIASIHDSVEKNRGGKIPDWAYRDVLFMLIYYSIAAFELLERKMTAGEKSEIYDVFYRTGMRMGLKDLPPDFNQWLTVRESHMGKDLARSGYTVDLFRQYKKHLGPARYLILKGAQALVVPERVRQLLGYSRFSFLAPAVPVYKLCRSIGLDKWIKKVLFPSAYYSKIMELDTVS